MHWTEKSIGDFLFQITFDFIAQIEQRMETLPLKQSDLAKKLGIGESAVSQVLNNPPNLKLKTIIKYARALGLKVALVAYDDNDPENKRGLVNSEVFTKCWEIAEKPLNNFDLQDRIKQHAYLPYFVLPNVRRESGKNDQVKEKTQVSHLALVGGVNRPQRNTDIIEEQSKERSFRLPKNGTQNIRQKEAV